MNATMKFSVVAAAALLTLSAFTGTASAQPKAKLYIQPSLSPDPHHHGVPRLGIVGHFDVGEGMHVENVLWGTPASRMGLESGDVILAINGRYLHCEADYFNALSLSSGYARLLIQDVRTGAVVSRMAYLGGGPSVYSSGPTKLFSKKISINY